MTLVCKGSKDERSEREEIMCWKSMLENEDWGEREVLGGLTEKEKVFIRMENVTHSIVIVWRQNA